MIKFNNEDFFINYHYPRREFFPVVSINGLTLGASTRLVDSLGKMAEALHKVDPNFVLHVFITTWDISWNNVWTDATVEYFKKYKNIKVHLSKEWYFSDNFKRYIELLCSNLNIPSYTYIPAYIFKPLAVSYINWKGVQNVNQVFSPTNATSKSECMVFKMKAASTLPMGDWFDKNLLNEFIKAKGEFKVSHNSYDKYFMSSPLDGLIVHRISGSFMSELNVVGSLSSFNKVFRFSLEDFAFAMSEFIKKNLFTLYEKNTLTSLSQLELIMKSPYDNRFEGGFWFSHLVKTAEPQVNYMSGNLAKIIYPLTLQSPFMYVKDNGKFHVSDKRIVDQLLNIIRYKELQFVLSEEEFSKLNYSSI